MKNLTLPQPWRTRVLKSSELPRLSAGHRLPTPRGLGAQPHRRTPARATAPAARRTARTARPPVRLPPWSRAPRPIAAHFALAPHGGVSRGRGGQWYSPSSPAPRTVGPSSRRKALWERRAAFLACALGRRPAAVRLPGWRGLGVRGFLASDAPGRWAPEGGETPLAAGRALSPWIAEGGGLASAALPRDRRRPRRGSQAGTHARRQDMGLSAFDLIGHRPCVREVFR